MIVAGPSTARPRAGRVHRCGVAPGALLRTTPARPVRVAAGADEKSGAPDGAPPTPAQPSTPRPPPADEPVWVRREREAAADAASGTPRPLPFPVYLLSSAIVAIAAVGSIFEWANGNPIFGVVPPSSPLYTPILGVFALTGLPTSGVLFYKAISSANAEAERQDRLDGYK
jgi:vacuolar iron transporter family protein